MMVCMCVEATALQALPSQTTTGSTCTLMSLPVHDDVHRQYRTGQAALAAHGGIMMEARLAEPGRLGSTT
jgi:hypothetical protein